MININSLSETELLDLNNLVVKRIKALRRASASRMGVSLRVGDRVTWSSRKGTFTGNVTKVNRVKAKVDVHGCIWTVPMSMLVQC
jgi:hypothetical protein